MEYKLSKYIKIIRKGSEVYIFSLISKILLEISSELLELLMKRSPSINKNHLNEKIFEELINYGFLINSELDEIEKLKFQHNSVKYNKTFLSLGIYPTLSCNFSCYYCFEKYKNYSISTEKVEILKKYVSKKSKDLNFIGVGWSGGEPLLVWNKIKDISSSFIESCLSTDTGYSASINTNGYFITNKIADEFKKYKIKTAQISLDGPPIIHNTIRQTNKDKTTFQKVIEGINIASQYVDVAIRVNINKKNRDYFEELLYILDESKIQKDKVRIFCRPVSCGALLNYSNYSENYTFKKFYEVEDELIGLSEKYNFPYSFHPNLTAKYRCTYHHINSYTIDPNLSLYKCPEFLGEEIKSIGKINDKSDIELKYNSELFEPFNYSPFEIQECKTCEVLPMCFGKCPVLWEQQGKIDNEGCIPEKYSLEKKLEYTIRNQNQQTQFIKQLNFKG